MPEDTRGHRRTPRRGRVTQALLSTLALLVVVAGMGAAFEYRHLNHNIDHQEVGKFLTHRPKRVLPAGPDGPINVLVMGYDGRDCDGCGIDGEHGAGGSDTTILLHISGDRSRVYGISIPRDSIVDRPACPRPGHADAPAATHVRTLDDGIAHPHRGADGHLPAGRPLRLRRLPRAAAGLRAGLSSS